MEKVLTISIAAYNVEKYIENTIQSCLNINTAKDIELLVIDDGGQDDTVEIAKKWQQQYPESVRVVTKENGGYGSTINVGIQLARGHYFKQLDGDDWFDTEGLERHINDLKVHDVDMAIAPNIKYFENNGKRLLRDNVSNMKTGEYDIESVSISGDVNMHSITYRTQLLRDINIKITEHCYYTDAEYVLFPLPYIKRIYVSHVPVYYYRIGLSEQSMSYIGLRKHFSDHGTVLGHIFDLYNGLDNKNMMSAKWIYHRLIAEVVNHYQYLCVLPISRLNFKALKSFDNKIKTNTELYKATGAASRRVSVLRKSAFLIYPFYCIYLKRKLS